MSIGPSGFKPTGYVNIDGLLAGVVHSGAASLHELKTVYSLEDAKWMEECFYIPNLNDRRFRERQSMSAEMRRRMR